MSSHYRVSHCQAPGTLCLKGQHGQEPLVAPLHVWLSQHPQDQVLLICVLIFSSGFLFVPMENGRVKY